MAKAVFLNGHLDNMKIIELDKDQSKVVDKISELLEVERANLRMLSFGHRYLMIWQNAREERTSLELTVSAGFGFPQFIRSKVIIYKFESKLIGLEEVETLVDVDMNELKKHFNMENAFWAMRKMYLTNLFDIFDEKETTEEDYLVKMEMDPSEDDD